MVGTEKQSMPCKDIKILPYQFICLSVHVVNAETITNVNVTSVERVESPSSHDLQIYGIVVTILLCFIVFGGVKMINRVAPAFLIPVVFSLFCIFIGIFLARKDKPAGVYFSTFLFWGRPLCVSLYLFFSMTLSCGNAVRLRASINMLKNLLGEFLIQRYLVSSLWVQINVYKNSR